MPEFTRTTRLPVPAADAYRWHARLQAPRHVALRRGFDPSVHARLVATNWIRTAAWSARSVLALAML
jgi:hypothetical protein